MVKILRIIRFWLIRLVVGQTPIMANMEVKGGILRPKGMSYFWDNTFHGSERR